MTGTQQMLEALASKLEALRGTINSAGAARELRSAIADVNAAISTLSKVEIAASPPPGVDMSALMSWALAQDPPACEDGLKRAQLGWGHLTSGGRAWIAQLCGPELLKVLARDPEYEVREAVAVRCGPELHALLAQDPDSRVRMAVAVRCGPELHEVFARDPDSRVRATVAQWCGPELLKVLARDPDLDVWLAVGERYEEVTA